MYKEYYEKYAAVLIKAALDLQRGEVLVINAAPWDYEFVRILETVAYQSGAKYVKCDYEDPMEEQYRCRYSDEEYLKYFPAWITSYLSGYAADKVAILDVSPPVFGADSKNEMEKLVTVRKTQASARAPYRRVRKEVGVSWVKTCLPSYEWAKQVYPELSEEEAFEKLWQNIIHIVRLDSSDPVQAWMDHKNMLREKKKRLDSLNIKVLQFEGPGTSLEVELVDHSVWTGGYDINHRTKREYIPNIPTEELFAVPHKYKVNGYVAATMPLNYNGSMICGIRLLIKDGKVVGYDADSGYDALKGILETDEGSCYFGEAALVAVTSPIYQSGIIYYNSLFDENAVCHMAFGNALIGGVKDAASMSEDETEAAGLNRSSIHVDFMMGSEEIKVTAVDQTGGKLILIDQGKWII